MFVVSSMCCSPSHTVQGGCDVVFLSLSQYGRSILVACNFFVVVQLNSHVRVMILRLRACLSGCLRCIGLMLTFCFEGLAVVP